MKWWK